MSFRLKLLLAMVLLVIGVTATTLLITQNLVSRSYQRHFQQSFRFQVDSFLQQRESRLEPVKDRISADSGSPRLFAVMENYADHPDQRDIDDLYQNAVDQLSDAMAAVPGGRTNNGRGFYFFLNNKGQLLYPSAQVKLPFSLLGLSCITQQLEAVTASLANESEPQVGYLAPEDESGAMSIREMVFTPLIDRVRHQKWGVLGLGFPLPAASHGNPILNAIWLDNRLYSSSIPQNALAAVARAVGDELRSGGSPPHRDFTIRVGDAPHQVYCQALNTGRSFPVAYQVYLYSLADALAEERNFRQRIVVSGIVASLCALALSWLISRSLTVPIHKLVAGTTAIERGNYTVKVKVQGRDELGRLGDAFNAMAERIQVTYGALEQRIAERTHELAERKRAEEALRKSEATLREAQRIAHLGNWEWNIVSNELRWSDEVYSVFGLAPQQFGATYESFLERVHPADREKVDQAMRRSLDSGEAYSIEHRVLRLSGEIRIVREQAENVRDASGKTTRMVGTVQDVTEQKRIEAEFLRAQRMDGIGAIAGGMAHDLNNALAPILMGIQLIRKKVAETEIHQMLAVMETNTHRSADMVRQVLTFARGREGEREILKLGRLLREMDNILRQTMPKSISVQALVPSDLWPVLGNATQLHQTLLNLCVNARDAMPKGGKLTLAADNVELGPEEAKEIPDARPGPFVMLLVSDNGMGIPPEVLPRIFDAFFTTKAPGKGTGLGLSTIVRIVRNHGGFVSVKSEVGLGTSFEIYLPRAEPTPARSLTSSSEPSALRAGHGELILFVDDDRSVREMVAPTLTEQGYRVLTASNGAEALAMLGRYERELRLVLTDVAMPVMDGVELAAKLHSRFPDLPVVLMSGTFDTQEKQLLSGATAFLAKPFRVEELLAVVVDCLRADHGLANS